jgi:hypothetical protein
MYRLNTEFVSIYNNDIIHDGNNLLLIKLLLIIVSPIEVCVIDSI